MGFYTLVVFPRLCDLPAAMPHAPATMTTEIVERTSCETRNVSTASGDDVLEDRLDGLGHVGVGDGDEVVVHSCCSSITCRSCCSRSAIFACTSSRIFGLLRPRSDDVGPGSGRLDCTGQSGCQGEWHSQAVRHPDHDVPDGFRGGEVLLDMRCLWHGNLLGLVRQSFDRKAFYVVG
jgi:hypothetical protein